MDTLVKTTQKNISARIRKKTTQSVFWKDAEENRLGITPVLLMIMSIIGGIAAATGILDSWIELAAVTFTATICLAMIISGGTMRAIFASTIIAITVDFLVILF